MSVEHGKEIALEEAKSIEFWFDFASTYSYLSAMRIADMAREAGVSVAWRPFLLGPAFLALGWNDSPFNIYPPKGRYMWRDLERLCDKYGRAFKRPSQFPRNGLLAARIVCANEDAAWTPDFVRAVFSANFAADRDIGDRVVIADILTTLGRSTDELIAMAEMAENKEKLRHRSEQAISLGLFGAPSFIVDGELFWGNDRLEDALDWARKSST
ncbi:MAG: 2-hydroxychromene-2-carboxylate isomerase [Sterolibacterium sp.]|nr:2-hydroxychromene-2-carboxylate isomerase [Sterolibacterium sp.]